jgi:hypothetical protein
MYYLRQGNLVPAAPVLVIAILALHAPIWLLKKSSQPASPSVVCSDNRESRTTSHFHDCQVGRWPIDNSPAGGGELEEESQLSRRMLKPFFQQTPSVILSQRSARGGPSMFRGQWFQAQLRTSRLPSIVGQNDDADTDENEVSTDDIEKYVSVYKAMQRDRTLTIDHAAAAQGLTIEQFRQLENRVQRDDVALQQARDELQAAAQGSPTPSESP